MRDVVDRLSAAGQLPPATRLRGVHREELNAWERELGLTLPADYRSFMELAGATHGAELFMGSGFFWPAPIGLREHARDSLEPEEFALVPDDALLILEHQGYIFVWLDTTDEAAPVCVLQPTNVDASEIKRIADSFREWLLSVADS